MFGSSLSLGVLHLGIILRIVFCLGDTSGLEFPVAGPVLLFGSLVSKLVKF